VTEVAFSRLVSTPDWLQVEIKIVDIPTKENPPNKWQPYIEAAKTLPIDKAIIVPLEGRHCSAVAALLYQDLLSRGLKDDFRSMQRKGVVYLVRR
jgi:rhodanese-related sulfurtransferase